VHDHAALHHALRDSQRVHCVFIFDSAILAHLPRRDRRLDFLLASVSELAQQLHALGGQLIVRHADAAEAIPQLAAELRVDAVYCNRDYEPQAIARDSKVAQALAADGRRWRDFKDQVIFDKNEVLSLSGQPFSIFTPYKNAWLKRLRSDTGGAVPLFAVDDHAARLAPGKAAAALPTRAQLGFEASNLASLPIPTGSTGAQQLFEEFVPRLASYAHTRDFPGVKGPSYLSVHLRFGTISIRQLVRHALAAIDSGQGGDGAAVWLSELIWRDFYSMILFHHPDCAAQAFKPAYDLIIWESGPHADASFQAWCEGRTGYPLVDAAMRQLNQTGYMHNRLRMVAACFLIKDLGIDYRRGEAFFAEHLNDFDLASNNGGWQWAASSGCDAQPYFRIFNPLTQSEKFDADGAFIRRYLPSLAKLSNRDIHAPWRASAMALQMAGVQLGEALAGSDAGHVYPLPIVMHDEARKRTLTRYAVVKAPGASAPDGS